MGCRAWTSVRGFLIGNGYQWLGGVAPVLCVWFGVCIHGRSRVKNSPVGKNNIRGNERSGPEDTTLANGNGFTKERENRVRVVVGAGAEMDLGSDFRSRSDLDGSKGVEDRSLMDGHAVADLDIPWDDDFDRRVDPDAFADLGTKEPEHRVAESCHRWGGESPEKDLAECPEDPGDLGLHRP